MQLADVLARFERPIKRAGGYSAACPCHDDRRQSLSIGEGKNGGVLLHCHAGCDTKAILEAVGLRFRDVAPTEERQGPALRAESSQNDKRAIVPMQSQIVATYDYCDEAGRLLFQKVRYAPKGFSQRHPDGKGGWNKGRGGQAVLFRLPAIAASDTVWICEGEKDCLRLAAHGRCATTAPDGAGPGKWKPSYNDALAVKNVIIIPDNDAVGIAYAREIADALSGVAKCVSVFDLVSLWPELPPKGDLSDFLDAMSAREPAHGEEGALLQIEAMIALALQGEAAPSEEAAAQPPSDGTLRWSEPIPLDAPDTKRSAFPLHAFPPPIRAFLEALAESTQTAPEMVGLLALGVLSATLLERCDVEVTPDWVEPVCLYVVAVAAPAERKSAVLGTLCAPLHAFEEERIRLQADEVAASAAECRMLEKRLQEAENKAAKGKGDRDEVRRLAAELASFERTLPFQLLADDCTPERLISLLAQQNGRIAIASSEGGIFDAMSGRYDKSLNLDVYLKAHAGDPIRVDRVGRASDKVLQPRLTLLLTIQPDVLEGLFTHASFRGRGLCGRFLYACCTSKVGHRRVDPPSIPNDVRQDYADAVDAMLRAGRSGTLTLDQDAQCERLAFMREIETRLGSDWSDMQDWAGKLLGATIRIAALLHIATHPRHAFETPIDAISFRAAVDLARVLAEHALNVYARLDEDEDLKNARYIWKRICQTGAKEIRKREIYRLCHGCIPRVERLDPPLALLETHGYIRFTEETTGGRPSKMILVNPRASVPKVPEL